MKSNIAVIAHRGASGYLPEHTAAAKALAYSMGADFLEQDVVASRDDELVVLHDIHLDRVTNVAEVFPDRHRPDGRFYVRDFDLNELRVLRVRERQNADGSAVYPGRFPNDSGGFRLQSLDDEFTMIRDLNSVSGRCAGVYPEVKRPAWHRKEGIDLAPLVLERLAKFGYQSASDPAYLQCFDDSELRRIRHGLGCELRLVQLVGENDWGEADTDFRKMQTTAGLRVLAQTVDAIGPWVNQLYSLENGKPISSGLVERAHDVGLLVHPYTLRVDDLPPGFREFDELLDFLRKPLDVDGVFTDFPDRVPNESLL